ncbi:PREDICTED: insulin-like growth factor-binding protein 1 [Nipponia nippon]|uniref:insulin-like growth factor-binding protein 1 n=1 Tax=Nipponia nippon TaxID=128390 RepID=UPI000510C6E3|nr:PREDICTED: insulin-like growth factor-binding protein 1 [Nipponia nippon]
MSSLRSLLRRCWLPSLLLPALLGPRLAAGVALQPMHCAPCTQEKLALCPPVAPGCPETARQPHSIELEDMPLESTEMTQDQLLNYQLMFPIGQDKSIPWNAITAYENMKAKRISEFKKWKEQGPCQKELYRALYKLAKAQQRSGGEIYKFYLPNCSKNGFYHSKQCETSLDGESAGCWCVYPKDGRRIPGSPEMKGDPECQQYLNSQE